MSGFWAGAVPPWAYATGGCLGVLLVMLGVWAGYGRGWRHAEEEARWAREQAKARRTHPVYRQPPEFTHEEKQVLDIWDMADEQGVLGWHQPAITTGEIQAITDETDIMVARWKADNDLWMAEHGLSDT